MKRFRPHIVVDNTRRPTQVLPAAENILKRFARHASMAAFETSSCVILSMKIPASINPADLYEQFYEAVGDGVTAVVHEKNVEIKMPKDLYAAGFTPASAYFN